MAVDSADTNGYVTEFYWDVGDNGLDETSTAPTISAIGWDANIAKYLKVWCKDDDGILSEPLYCWVYPDSVPEIPLQISEAKVGTDSVKLTWSGNDVKDGDALQFQILCDKSNPPTTEVKSFGICEKSGNDFFTVIPIASNGRYYWKVTARDARESETTSLSVRVFDFPLP
jgi:hypothetical protein